MQQIIGKKFRRNKYGLSLWEDTVLSIEIVWSANILKSPTELTPRFMIKGILNWYWLDECVFYHPETIVKC